MSHHPAITISRSLGSGGTRAGFLAARELGWHFCDRRILRKAAEASGLSTEALGKQEERRRGFLDQVLTVFAMGSAEAPFVAPVDLPIYTRDLFAMEREVMAQLLEHAPSVLVGRGGFVALRGRTDTLHVSIHAALPFRIQFLLDAGKAANPEAARQAIAESDRNRGGFIRDISGLDWQDPANFDLVLDPAELGIPGTAARMVAAVRERLS